MGVEPVAELVGHHALHKGLGFGVAELGLGLAFELRVGEFDGDHGRQAFAHVVAGQVLVLVFEDGLVTRVTVDQRGQCRTEALLVGAAFGGGNRVRKGVHSLGVGGSPLHGEFSGNAELEVFGLEADDILFHRCGLAHLDQVVDVILDAVEVLVGDGLVLLTGLAFGVAGHFVAGLVSDAFVGQAKLQALVQEGHLLEAGTQRLEIINGGFKDLRVGPEGHGCTGGFALGHRLTLLQRRNRMLVDIGLGPVEALTAHFDVHVSGQGVHHGDAHAVQTAGHRVAAATKLAAGVQLGHHGFNTGDAFARNLINRNASAIVHHANTVVRQDSDFNMAGISSQRLIDRVIDDFVDQVVQTTRTGGADVHTWTDTHGFKTFKYSKVRGLIMLGRHGFVKLAFGQFRIVDAFRSRLQLLLFAGFFCQQASFRDYGVNLCNEGHLQRRYGL